MATEVPANEHPARDRHQLQTLILAITLLLTVAARRSSSSPARPWLNRFGFLHFPLGFYLLAQGLLIFIVVVAFWFIRIQERIDLARSETRGTRQAMIPSRLRTPNPHLGAYYGIVTSAFVSLIIIAGHVRAARLGPAAARADA